MSGSPDRCVSVDTRALREGREQLVARQEALVDAIERPREPPVDVDVMIGSARGREYFIGDSSMLNSNEGLQGTLAHLDTPLGMSVGACVKCLVLVNGRVESFTEIEAVVDGGHLGYL